MIFIIIQFLILAVVLYYFNHFYILPKLRMRYYKNQGLKEYKFAPFYGWLKDALFQKTNEYKDSLYELKRISINPEFKDEDILVGNAADQAYLTLVDPNLINEFLQKQNDYIKYEFPVYGFIKFVGYGLARTYGDAWKQSRKVISNMFTFENISNQFGRIKDISRAYIASEDINNFNIKYCFERVSGSSNLQVLLGAEVEKYKDSQGRHLGELIEQIAYDITLHYISPFPLFFGQKVLGWGLRDSDRKLTQRMKDMRKVMTQIITDCVNREKDPSYKPKYPSYVTYLLKAGLLQKSEEIDELFATAFSLFMAAKDTTSKITCMVIHNLIKNPQQYKLVQEEVIKHCSNDDYTHHDLQQLNHLQANIKESMRMDPSAPFVFSRQAIKDTKLGKYNIKKGTLVQNGTLANLYNSKYFNDPFEYNPSRWFDKDEDMRMKENHFVFIPFSGGARNCLGQHLAMMQIKIMMIEFVRKFDIPSIPDDFNNEKNLTQSYGFKYPLIVKLAERKK